MLKSKKAKGKSQKHNLKGKTFYFCLVLFTFNFLLLTFYCAAQESFVYNDKGKRNPFIPLVTSDGRLLKLDKEETSVSDLVVEGIIYDKHGRSFAIVNSAVVGIGDIVDGYRVLKIEVNKVVMIKDGQIKEAFINKEEK